MKSSNSLVSDYHIQHLRKNHLPKEQTLIRELTALRGKNFSQLADCFRQFIPENLLRPSEKKAHSRRRVFSKENTFWAFFSQVIDPDGGCTEVVRKLRDETAEHSTELPAASTSAYCQARKKLESEELLNIFQHTAGKLDDTQERGFLNHRRVIVADDTAVSMPNTAANKKAWPQQTKKIEDREFPAARICACFSLATGGLLSFKMGDEKNQDVDLFRKQWNTFRANDILLGNQNFCRYFDLTNLKQRGVDSIVMLAHRQPFHPKDADEVLAEDDLLITWKRPNWNKRLSYTKEQWKALSKELSVRQVRLTLNVPGLQEQSFYIITTLLDATVYPADQLLALYLQRWNVELFFRDIKTTMGMNTLRCKTPSMVTNEIIMHCIAYNGVRMLMHKAA